MKNRTDRNTYKVLQSTKYRHKSVLFGILAGITGIGSLLYVLSYVTQMLSKDPIKVQQLNDNEFLISYIGTFILLFIIFISLSILYKRKRTYELRYTYDIIFAKKNEEGYYAIGSMLPKITRKDKKIAKEDLVKFKEGMQYANQFRRKSI